MDKKEKTECIPLLTVFKRKDMYVIWSKERLRFVDVHYDTERKAHLPLYVKQINNNCVYNELQCVREIFTLMTIEAQQTAWVVWKVQKAYEIVEYEEVML